VRRYVVPAVVLVGICAALFILRGEIRAWWHRDYTEIREVTGSNWFDYPVGAPNAKGYYRAQKFYEGNTLHLGEDWNGDPVYAIADGKVTFAQDAGGGWGNVVRIIHHVNSQESVDAVYAHLSIMEVHKGDKVRRGQI